MVVLQQLYLTDDAEGIIGRLASSQLSAAKREPALKATGCAMAKATIRTAIKCVVCSYRAKSKKRLPPLSTARISGREGGEPIMGGEIGPILPNFTKRRASGVIGEGAVTPDLRHQYTNRTN